MISNFTTAHFGVMIQPEKAMKAFSGVDRRNENNTAPKAASDRSIVCCTVANARRPAGEAKTGHKT